MALSQQEISDLVSQITANAQKLGLIWQIRPGEIAGSDSDGNALVLMDGGGTAATPATPLDGMPATGARVFVVSVPPNGDYIIGAANGPQVGSETVTPDASGFSTITHGLGYTPSVIIVQPESPITGSPIFGQVVVDSLTSTTFRVRCLSSTGAAITTSVTFTWVAYP